VKLLSRLRPTQGCDARRRRRRRRKENCIFEVTKFCVQNKSVVGTVQQNKVSLMTISNVEVIPASQRLSYGTSKHTKSCII
jgi:hypothetical protein